MEHIPYLQLNFDVLLMKARRGNHPLRKLSRGFDVFPHITTPDRSSEASAVWLALEHLALFTLHIDNYIGRRHISESLSVIGELRNYVQHRVMALVDTVCGTESLLGDDLIGLALLASGVYSYTCVFPIPAAPFTMLSKRIRRSCQSLGMEQENTLEHAQPLMVWILCMGAIATAELADRIWYAAAIARILRAKGIDTWPRLRALLLDFLWLPMTNDGDGERVWSEVDAVLVRQKHDAEQ